ncbi:ADK-domain-containing protein [Melanogaster broomeanus]|nr:ADK-domain-containing protein [Melanogaster broomeanus]
MAFDLRRRPNPLLFIGLSLVSCGAFFLIVKHREATHPASKQPRQHDNPLVPPRHHTRDQNQANGVKTPFDSNHVTVIYVLGGPGAGKGTQCAKLVEDFNFSHLSAGDLLRAEQNREGSDYGDSIGHAFEITINLLQIAMSAEMRTRSGPHWSNGRGRFLIDGFPREMDQALKFDETVCIPSQVLVFEADQEVMMQRILERGKTSGREDDNTHTKLVEPVIAYYETQGKVVKV